VPRRGTTFHGVFLMILTKIAESPNFYSVFRPLAFRLVIARILKQLKNNKNNIKQK
jgi:hypothetical protein